MRVRRSVFLSILTAFAAMAACEARPKVTISTRTGQEVVFHVEVADTPAKREMGLQYRRELANERGMIFLFASESPQTFWMKNTPIPLDMIFISRDREIVGIVEQAAPFSLESRTVGRPSQFVLEINGGLAKKFGIETGNKVRFGGIPSAPVAE